MSNDIPSIPSALVDMNTLMKLATELRSVSSQGMVEPEDFHELQQELEAPEEHMYAALAMAQLSLPPEHEMLFAVCTGSCLQRGALASLSELIKIKKERLAECKEAFDIVPRTCLNRCQAGPVVELRSKKGNMILAGATPEIMNEVMQEYDSL